MTDKPKTRVRFYRIRNRLKDKLGGGRPGELTIPKEALEQAQAAFEKMAEDYPDWVTKHIEQLRVLHARCVDTPEHRAKIYVEIHEIAHDMRGQGGTFGYPLITTFAASLYEFTAPKAVIGDNQIEIIKAHIDSMSAVIKGRVKGSGGTLGAELAANLSQAIAKYETV